jgi:tetratricopeptide (TPR) repeat protein
MSKTLSLIDRLLEQGRNFQQMDQHRQAVHVLGRLARLTDLPTPVAEETQHRLAELHLKRRKFSRARKNLAALLRLCPDNARYHFLMATAIRGEKKDPERALGSYRKSLQLDPRQPECLSAYGLHLVRLGQAELGLKCLREAAELEPDHAIVFGRLVRGLRRTGAWEEARRVLIAGLFRNPRDGRFRRLYNDFMFRQLRRAQKSARRPSLMAEDRQAVVLPFIRLADEPERVPAEHTLIRLDPASPIPAPHSTPRPVRRHDWKHG